MKQLILNADDFGLTPGINRAVIELHQAGVVTSATLMATGPAFDDAVALALAHPTLAFARHLRPSAVKLTRRARASRGSPQEARSRG